MKLTLPDKSVRELPEGSSGYDLAKDIGTGLAKAAVAVEVDGVAKVVKCNLDDGQAIAAKYGIRSITTLVFFKDGEVKDQIVGANVTQGQISEKLKGLA